MIEKRTKINLADVIGETYRVKPGTIPLDTELRPIGHAGLPVMIDPQLNQLFYPDLNVGESNILVTIDSFPHN